jgi:hypothetical protein
LHLLEDLDRNDVEARPSIDESAVEIGIMPMALVEIGWSSSSKLSLLEDHFSLGLLVLGCAAAISHDSCLK